MCVVPGPASQDAVYKGVCASLGLQCRGLNHTLYQVFFTTQGLILSKLGVVVCVRDYHEGSQGNVMKHAEVFVKLL
jgi:hypothetical protein